MTLMTLEILYLLSLALFLLAPPVILVVASVLGYRWVHERGLPEVQAADEEKYFSYITSRGEERIVELIGYRGEHDAIVEDNGQIVKRSKRRLRPVA